MAAPQQVTATDVLIAAVVAELEARRGMLDAAGRLHSVSVFVPYKAGKPASVNVKPETRRELP